MPLNPDLTQLNKLKLNFVSNTFPNPSCDGPVQVRSGIKWIYNSAYRWSQLRELRRSSTRLPAASILYNETAIRGLLSSHLPSLKDLFTRVLENCLVF